MAIRRASLLVLSLSVCAVGLMGLSAPVAPPSENPDEIIKDIEKTRPAAPASAPAAPASPTRDPVTVSTPTEASATTGTKLVREGTFITSRRGRVARGVTGEMLFTFDADAKGRNEPAMVLMPCMNLAGMERIVERAGESVTFTLSGQVFVYKGRNYILPTLYQVNRRPADLNTAQ